MKDKHGQAGITLSLENSKAVGAEPAEELPPGMNYFYALERV